MLGKKLAHYEITAKIGAGGMGEVYQATDTRLGRTVAIKVLPGHLSEKPDLRARFEREARAISSLSHPHICTLHDVGHVDGLDYLVMEYLEGETLSQRLAQARLPMTQVLTFGTQIASALDAAHRRGIVHRDLKPGNVMLTRNGVKLLDFGLAKLVEAPTNSSMSAVVTEPRSGEPLTERGTILGTFRYMAPEQLEGGTTDLRTDIFALGAVLYEMAAGRPAFEGKSQASLIAAILEREPAPLASIEPLTPPAFDRTIRRCLAKDPDARWQSAADVASELQWISDESSRAGVPVAVTARRRSRERLLWMATVPLLALAVALGVAVQRLATHQAPVVRASIESPKGTFFDLNSFGPGPMAISPDGRKVVFTTIAPNDSLWVRTLDEAQPRFLLAGSSVAYPFWSPDGRSIAFFSGRKLRRVDVDGGPPLSLADAPNGKGGTWNEHGVIVFAPDADVGLVRVAATGGDTTTVTRLDATRGENSHRLPSFLPDGEHFLFYARSTAPQFDPGTVMVGSLSGSAPRAVMRSASAAIYASGRLLFARESTLLAQPFDLRRFATHGEPTPIAEAVELLTGAACAAFSASREGTLVYHPDQPDELNELVWFDRSGQRVGTLGDPAAYQGLRFSPDGKRLAVGIVDPDTGRTDLWIYDVARGVRTRFTFDPMFERAPVWSPDGAYLYFSSNRRGHFDIYRKALVGADVEELVLESDTDKQLDCCSPDGRLLLFSQDDDLWQLPLMPGAKPSLLLKGVDNASISRDGRWMSYVSASSGPPQLYATTFPRPGRTWQVSRSGSFAGSWWTPTEMFYVDLDGKIWIIDVVPDGTFDLTIGEPRLSMPPSNRINDGELDPDGKRVLLAMSLREPSSQPAMLVLNWTSIHRR